MTIKEISDFPTCIKREGGEGLGGGWHESVLRAFQILEKVKYLLREGVPPKIILELVAEMEGKEADLKELLQRHEA